MNLLEEIKRFEFPMFLCVYVCLHLWFLHVSLCEYKHSCAKINMQNSEDNFRYPFLLSYLYEEESAVTYEWDDKLSKLWTSGISLVSVSHITVKELKLKTGHLTFQGFCGFKLGSSCGKFITHWATSPTICS